MKRALLSCLCGLFFAAHLWSAPMPVQVAEGLDGMVASGHPDATAAGLDVLKSGGNAMDAAVAVSMALGVTEPYGSGLGGKLVLVYREAATGKIQVVEALDAAPAGLNPTAYKEASAETRKTGGLSIGIPGMPAGILLAHQRWGRLPLTTLLAPAIKLARDGFKVRDPQVKFFRAQSGKLKANPEAGRIYMPGGYLPEAGDVLRNEDLAHTLELIAAKGANAFYRGPVAEAIVKAMQVDGSPARLDDFARYQAHVSEPLMVRFHGYGIYSVPPPVSGGGIFLLTLAALGEERLPGDNLLNAPAMDRVMRLFIEADAAGRSVLGDREDSRRRWEQLTTPASLAELQRKATATAQMTWRPDLMAEDEAMAAETTHFVVVDKAGNVVSATQSQSNHFGSGLVPAGTGVVLNNSLSNFNRVTGNPNEVAPGRRPRTTIAPTIIMKDGKFFAALGLPGGSRIPTAMVQVTVDHLYYGTPLDEAIAKPRFHALTRRSGDSSTDFETEKESDYKLAARLKTDFGWKDGTDPDTESFGGVNAIERTADGVLHGYADQRRSNSAMGY